MQVIENFLPESLASEIETAFTSRDFPWYYYDNTLNMDLPDEEIRVRGYYDDGKTKETSQFVHAFYVPDRGAISGYYHLVHTMMHYSPFTPTGIFRIKCNMITKQSDYPIGFHHGIHSDTRIDIEDYEKMKILLYYPIDSDGDTIVYDKKAGDDMTDITELQRITPKRNTAVVLDACQLHTSSPPIESDIRLSLNVVYFT